MHGRLTAARKIFRSVLNALGDFARILDSKSWGRVGEVFANDVTFNHGDGQEQAGIAELRSNFSKFLYHCGATQHLLGSIQIEIDGYSAFSRA